MVILVFMKVIQYRSQGCYRKQDSDNFSFFYSDKIFLGKKLKYCFFFIRFVIILIKEEDCFQYIRDGKCMCVVGVGDCLYYFIVDQWFFEQD